MKSKLLTIILLALVVGCKKENGKEDVIVIKASGNITASVDAFRQLLGSTLNTTPGAIGGRREINWEGIPDELLGKPLPPGFLNSTEPGAPASSQRGFEYESIGSFQVSKSNFAEVNPQAAGEFSAFSGNKVFTNTSEVLWDGSFEIPGQNVPATVRGFGIVFADVDVANNSSIEFFDGNKSLGKFFVPVQQAGSKFSFLGVYFKDQKVSRVRVQHGNGQLTEGGKDISGGGGKDLVILDDFMYDEPVQR
jgi:hypothetical protein